MKNKTSKTSAVGNDFDEHLHDELMDPAMAAHYINAALEEHDFGYLKVALGKVVRVHGVADISKIANLNRESIYKMLSAKGNPEFESMLQILEACGLEIAIHPKGKPLNTPKAERDYVRRSEIVSLVKSTVQREVRRIGKVSPMDQLVEDTHKLLRTKPKSTQKRATKKG